MQAKEILQALLDRYGDELPDTAHVKLTLNDRRDSQVTLGQIREAVKKRYGCHADGYITETCVIDSEDYHDCVYAKHGMKREDCREWREIKEA